MPNRNYEAGRRLEYLVMGTLRNFLPHNCRVYRTAGSHSEADVIVIEKRRNIKRAVTIQCKSRKARKKT